MKSPLKRGIGFFLKKKIGNEITYKDVEMYYTSSNETFMYLAFLRLQIIFNVKAETNVVSLANQNYMIATG